MAVIFELYEIKEDLRLEEVKMIKKKNKEDNIILYKLSNGNTINPDGNYKGYGFIYEESLYPSYLTSNKSGKKLDKIWRRSLNTLNKKIKFNEFNFVDKIDDNGDIVKYRNKKYIVGNHHVIDLIVNIDFKSNKIDKIKTVNTSFHFENMLRNEVKYSKIDEKDCKNLQKIRNLIKKLELQGKKFLILAL